MPVGFAIIKQMRSVCVAFLCLISSVTSAATNGVLRSVSELYDYLNHRYPTDLTFDVTATIGDAGNSNIIAEDDDAYAMIYFPPSMTGRFHYGDRVRIRGGVNQEGWRKETGGLFRG